MDDLITIHLCDALYDRTWELQREVFRLRSAGKIPDVLFLVEHPPVYTVGRKGGMNHVLLSRNELEKRGITVREIDRGGGVTYHGPGQLVCYPIISLRSRYLDVHRYLRELEEVIIRSVKRFGIVAGRDPHHAGVWVGESKLAAIGVKVSSWITMHGFALNVTTDLSYFRGIIPCGIADRGVASMGEILGRRLDLWEVASEVENQFCELFRSCPYPMDIEEFRTAFVHGTAAQEVVDVKENEQ